MLRCGIFRTRQVEKILMLILEVYITGCGGIRGLFLSGNNWAAGPLAANRPKNISDN